MEKWKGIVSTSHQKQNDQLLGCVGLADVNWLDSGAGDFRTLDFGDFRTLNFGNVVMW